MKVGLFFGSFNPIHIGHLIIANHLAEYTDLEEIWLVVTPRNPLKSQSSLLNDYIRLEMVQNSVSEYPKLKVSTIEFSLPKPSYTVDTLAHLEEKHPDHQFCLIMGMDNLISLPKWKNYEHIKQNYPIYVYPRPSYEAPLENNGFHSLTIVEGMPSMQISATFIRNAIKENKNVTPLLPPQIAAFLDKNHYYKNPLQ